MKRWRNLLLCVLAIEAIACGVLVSWRLVRRPAPLPELAVMDALTDADLRSKARRAGTTAEWRELAEDYMTAGYFREAEACHRLAAEWNPDNAELIRQWGFALER
jgi:hypothetical protein